jgi:CheY-like chemotaxis protein
VKERILLITSMDDTYRKPLLETEGYQVHAVPPGEADQKLTSEQYEVVLIATNADGPGMLDFCTKVRNVQPAARIGVVAQRSEYITPNDCIDAVFRNQHSPGKFLAAVRKLINLSPGEKQISENDD